MQGQDIGLTDHILLIGAQDHPFRNGRYIRVVSQDFHPQAQPHLGYPAPDVSYADDSQGLPQDLHAWKGILGGKANFLIGMGHDHQVLGQGQHQGDGVFRHGLAVGSRGDGHGDAMGLAPFHRDVVIPDAVFADDFQIGGRLQQLRRQLIDPCHHSRSCLDFFPDESIISVGHHHFAAGCLQELRPHRIHILCKEHFGHFATPFPAI